MVDRSWVRVAVEFTRRSSDESLCADSGDRFDRRNHYRRLNPRVGRPPITVVTLIVATILTAASMPKRLILLHAAEILSLEPVGSALIPAHFSAEWVRQNEVGPNC